MTKGVSVWTVSSLVFRTATSMSWAGDDCGGTCTMAVGVLRREVILSLASSRYVIPWLPPFFSPSLAASDVIRSEHDYHYFLLLDHVIMFATFQGPFSISVSERA